MTVLCLIFLLVSNSVAIREDISTLSSRTVIFILLYSVIICYVNYYVLLLGTGIGIYGGLFFVNSVTHIFHILIYILTSIILIFTAFHSRKVILNDSSAFTLLFHDLSYYNTGILNKMSEIYRILEYPLIILFIINGALFLICASDLVSMFIAIELQSYGLYLLSTIYKNSETATAGGLMYFLLGGLSSCFILLGTSLLYVNSGTTNLDNLYVINNISTNLYLPIIDNMENNVYNNYIIYTSYYIIISLIIMIVGFLFKVSAAPFHFWSPDVYDAIPTTVTTFVAIIAKISIFIFLLELVHYLSKSSFNYSWTNSLLISSLLSLIIGTVLGLTQSRIKRLYAYSTISHVGFILLALSIHTIESNQAFMVYLIQYSVSNLNAFIILVSIGYLYYNYTNVTEKGNEKKTEQLSNSLKHKNILISDYVFKQLPQSESRVNNEKLEYRKNENINHDKTNINSDNLKDKDNSPIQLISQLKGYFYINPILCLSLTITLFSFAGIPPLVGFFGKMMVLSSAIDNGYIFMALVAILTSVIGAVYYLFIIKEMYFSNTDYKINNNVIYLNLKATVINVINNNILNKSEFNYNNIVLSNYLSIIISTLTLIILLFISIPDEFFNLLYIVTHILFQV